MSFPETGLPDAWIRLWTPHRGQYLHDVRSDGTVDQSCPFCSAPEVKDEDSLVVFKGKLNYVVLNLYPYNAGHLLVAPFRHFADFTTITNEESDEMSELTRKAMSVLRKASGAQGFNIGMNQGLSLIHI